MGSALPEAKSFTDEHRGEGIPESGTVLATPRGTVSAAVSRRSITPSVLCGEGNECANATRRGDPW